MSSRPFLPDAQVLPTAVWIAETPAAHFGDGDLRQFAHDIDDLGDAAEAAGAAAVVLAAHVVEIAPR